MKRNIVVAVCIVAFLGLLVWAGFKNIKRRKEEQAKVHQAEIKLMPAEGNSDEDAPKDLRGKAAPDFTLKTLDGAKISLASLKGKPVIVNFWATWCAPCKIEMPWFEEYRKQNPELQIVGITEDKVPLETVKATAARAGATYPITMTDGKIDNEYGGVDYLPSTFYINREGVIVAQSNGLAPKEEMGANIKKIMGN